MATKEKKQNLIITPTFRVSYPAVFHPQRNELANPPRDEYVITMLFDKKTAKTDLVELKALCKEVAEEKWGVGKIPAGLKSPFRDGDLEKPDNPSYAGCIFVRSWSKFMPGLVNQKREPILNEDEFYGGCYARAQVNVYGYDMKGNKGVSLGLTHIQKVKDGDPFGSRTRAEDAFSPVDGASDDSPASGAGGMFD